MTPKSIEASPVHELKKLKRQFQKERKGYREAKYQILASAMAEVVKLRSDEDELEAFIVATGAERPTVESQSRSWITVAAVSFVTHNRQLAWKGARVLDYLYDVREISLDNIAQEIREQGGIEKILKIAAEEDPRREEANETDEEENEAHQEEEAEPSCGKPKKRGLGPKSETKAPDISEDSSEQSEIAVSISPELRTKLDAIKVGRRVKLIGVRAEQADWVDIMLDVQEVRLLKR